MRKFYDSQLTFKFYHSDSKQSKKMQIIDNFLEKHRNIFEEIKDDFRTEKNSNKGARGLSVEQVVRIGIIKQFAQLSYRKLYDALNDNICYRNFSKIHYGFVPKFNVLCENIKKISPRNWKKINEALVKYAEEEGIEDGKKVRIDSTGVESNIHYPTDGELLWDCIRVIDRIIETVKYAYPDLEFNFQNHTRRSKKRRFKIVNTSKKEHRLKAYKDLIKVSKATEKYSVSCIEALSEEEMKWDAEAQVYKKELKKYLKRLRVIINQTERRVLRGEKVASKDKLVSIFEEHTDILAKGKRKVIFGHKILLTGGASNLILDCIIERGNWSDAEKFKPAIDQVEKIYSEAPNAIAADGGFASRKNYEYATTEKGVDKVVFTKRASAKIEKLIKTSRAYKNLKKFRAGIEGCISAVKRAYGLSRCTWRGWESFQSYVWASIIAFNLNVIAVKLL